MRAAQPRGRVASLSDAVHRRGALEGGARRLPFHVANWEVASSFYPPNRAFLDAFPGATSLLATRKRRRISTTTLDDVADREGLAPDCLKLDVEGAELDVLVGGEKALGGVLALEAEVEFNPVFGGQPMFCDVDRHLRERGWALLGLRRNSWRRGPSPRPGVPGYGGQLVAADALYLNERGASEPLAVNRELKLLVILAAYHQWDLLARRLAGSPALAGLPEAERTSLTRALVPDPGLLRRLLGAVGRRLGPERRRALADALQPAQATVWQDPHFF